MILRRIVLFILFIKVSILLAAEEKFKIVCYFANWAYNRPSGGSMTPEDIDPCLCTHVIYAFSEMENNQLIPTEKHDLKDKNQAGFFERFNAWKSVNKNLKTLLAVGGWDMGMKDFAGIVKSEKTMKSFAESSVKYLRKHKFDGLDLDFEYPGVDWRDSPKEDKQKFTRLCEVLYETFEKEASKSGNERLLLTAAVAAAKINIDKAYEIDKLVPVLDWFNLMTYDFHGSWDQNRAHHSSLNSKDDEKDDTMYIDFAVKYFQKLGMPPNKMLLGLGTYGRGDTPAMPYTGFKGESGFVAYYESCIQIVCEKMKETWDAKQLVPYIAGPYNQPKAGVENVRSMKYKANYIKQNNLGGAMIWTLDMDDFRGQFCCQGKFPLIKTIKAVLHGQLKLLPKEKICSTCPTTEYKNLKANSNYQPPTTTPTEKTTKKAKLSKRDAEGPTPEDVCEELKDGQWPDPSDCKSYFLCRGVGSQWGEQKREMCYAGSYFDPNDKTCKWVGADKLNCEELVEGYENPVSGLTVAPGQEEDDIEDEDITDEMGKTSKKKISKSATSLSSVPSPSSNKQMSILSRTTSEFDTCAPEKSVEFDPVQAFYRYALLLLRKSEGEQRVPNKSKSNDDDDVRIDATDLLQQKNHKRRRKTTTVQPWLYNATFVDGQYYSRVTMSIKQSRRKDRLREILPGKLMQQSGYKRWRTADDNESNDIRHLLSFISDILCISSVDENFVLENITMDSGGPNITTLIICICVIVPAVIAISVCGILYYSNRHKDRKIYRPPSRPLPYDYEQTRERASANNYIIDFTHVNRSQQQQRRPRSPPAIEQSPPAYYITTIETRPPSIPRFSSIRTIPTSTYTNRSSPTIAPSIHSIMPPSYADIFLRPHTLPNE
ncbi:unnamed protein product [Rotaria socialis]|uniref:Chitinase n=2 Tax=Rotaria socialis TaxID=392032 RepID=A0A820SB77_9BILA|nr:unnamed protein product [Rotaria socialis]CAF4556894.1 unnamed protein product [Rotaria socialis]